MVSVLISFKAFAQRPSTGIWLNVQLPLHINNRWQMPTDFNYRTLGTTPTALQQLHRIGLRYNFTKNWSVAVGAAAAHTRTTFSKQNNEFAKEFRYWQEVNYKTALTNTLQTQIRIRTEQRFFSATSTKAAFHAFRYRIKPQLVQKFSEKWGLLIADEYMQQHANNKWSFDQNRLIVNGLYYFNKTAQLQAGYMWLRWPAHSSQHILTLSFLKTISLHAKQ
ncbi:DUF2490 domain-containing protein [Ferruginibacter sp.]